MTQNSQEGGVQQTQRVMIQILFHRENESNNSITPENEPVGENKTERKVLSFSLWAPERIIQEAKFFQMIIVLLNVPQPLQFIF